MNDEEFDDFIKRLHKRLVWDDIMINILLILLFMEILK